MSENFRNDEDGRNDEEGSAILGNSDGDANEKPEMNTVTKEPGKQGSKNAKKKTTFALSPTAKVW